MTDSHDQQTEKTPPLSEVRDPSDTLQAALTRHNIELPAEQVARIDEYCKLLWEWNEKINLTRHTTYERFVARDIVDSLAFSRHLKEDETVLDVGTGGGVPGIILAIIRPDVHVELCESMEKKAKVVQDIVNRMGLKTMVYHARAEKLLQEESFDTLVMRAVAPLEKLLNWFSRRWGAFHRLLILKGPNWLEEKKEAMKFNLLVGKKLHVLEEFPLPGTTSKSALLEITVRTQ